MNLSKKITGGILLVVVIFALCQGLVMHSIISSTGENEIQTMHRDELNKTKQKLKNYVEIAYNIIESNYENSQSKEWLQKEYGLQLNKIIDIAESIIKGHIAMVAVGELSEEAAKKRVLESIGKLRYSADTGYVWVNDVGSRAFSRLLTGDPEEEIPEEVGMGYVWINDMGKPFPRMLMHPTIPTLNRRILDDKRFNCALGVKKNLFVAMVDVAQKDGEGFVDYVWPKPTRDGLSKEQTKLSYVRAIPEWDWLVGTGIYVDDALDKAIEKSKQDLKKMRYRGGEGYFWINDEGVPYPKMIMHPTMPDLDGKVMDDPKFNVVLGEPKHLFRAIRRAADNEGGGFVNYIWPKPTSEGLTIEEPKLSYVRSFLPFGWIIGTGIYIDSIDRLVEEKIRTIKSTNYYLLMTILSVAVVLFLFLTTASYFLIDRFFIRKINQANDELQLEIEERKKTENELIIARKHSEVANSAKSEFLANMSHEIRTPMNAVIGLAHLLEQTELTEQQADYLIKISLSADNLLSIINDILDFSKIEAGKLGIENIPFNLRVDILQNVTQVVGLTAAEKGLEVMLDLEHDVPDQLIGDPFRLRQILINLLNNAVKFTEKGHVTLVVNRLESENAKILLWFEVRDTGIGMNEEQLKSLFSAFSQADASTTRRFGGTGLGLTISKKLAEMMGGEIGASSIVGEGSTFWFSARFLLDTEAKEQDLPVLTDDIINLKVLVVDNNEAARLILRRQLEQFGYHVTEAENGEEAIYILQNAEPGDAYDLILLDWMMPGMDGIETARHVQTGIGFERVPAIIMLTAYDKKKLYDAAKDIVLNEVLTKPIFPSELLNAILSTFGKTVAKRKGEDSDVLPDHVIGARVLLVEDNFINQEVAKEILMKAGVWITIAEDGERGLQRLQIGDEKGDPFDVVLMDIQMPVMDGYTATREIRKLLEYKDLPIVAMTANAFVSDRQKALASGMNDHVAKPIKVKELFKVLGEVVHVPEERRNRPEISDDTSSLDNEKNILADLPEVEGLDMAAGIQRSAGNISLYEGLLSQFILHHSEDIDQINSALSDNDHELAARIAHTLKGVAGNIGAERLYLAAGVAEDAILKSEESDPPPAVTVLEEALHHLLAGLRDAYPEEEEGDQIEILPGNVDLDPVQPILASLEEYIADDNPEAVDFYMENKGHLAQAIPREALNVLEKNLRSFDFEAALEEINGIRDM